MTYLQELMQTNSDYLYFLSGLFYLLVAGIAFHLYRRRESHIPWFWFSLFALSIGLPPWLALIDLNVAMKVPTREIELAAGFTALLGITVFGRQVLPVSLPFSAVIALAAAAAVWHDPEKLHLTSAVFLFIPSMILGAAVFWKCSRTFAPAFYLPLAILMAAHALMNGIDVFSCLAGLYCSGTSVSIGNTIGIVSGSFLFGLLWTHYLRFEGDADKLPAATLPLILLPLLMTGILIMAGWGFVQYLGNLRGSQLKNELMIRTQVAANSVNMSRISLLSATGSDIATPAYEKIKRHLIRIRVVSRFVYLFTFRDGQVIFIADSEPEGSPDLSPPGQVLNEASPAFLKSIRSGKPTVLDPETDRWGTWVSAFVPLAVSLPDGSPVYFGADIDAAEWGREINHTRLIGIGVILFFALFLLYFQASLIHIRRINMRLSEELSLFVGGPSFVMKWVNSHSHFRPLYTSPNIDPLLGYSADEIVSGKIPFPSLIHPEERGAFDALLQHLSSEPGKKGECTLRLLNRHGEYQWFHAFILSKNHIYSLSYHAYFTDINEKKEAELAFQQLSERLMLHFKQAPFAIIEWDTNFRVVEWNPAAERIFGYSRDETIGKKAGELILPHHAIPQTDRVMSELLAKQGGECNINDNTTKAGKIITCEWHNTQLVDGNGTIIGIASIAEDITEKKAAEAKIRYLAYYDELTGLPNRTLLKDRLQLECRRSDRNRHLLAVIFIDLDFFKTINDTLGHDVGDTLLRSVSERLQKHFRSSDTISRFSGDEFAILLPDIKAEEDVEHLLQGLLKRFATPLSVSGHELHVTLSIGYTLYPTDNADPELLLRNADIAMYSAKESGRNMVRRYHGQMSEAVSSQLEIHNGLVNALKNHEFVLYYQPQYDLQEGRISGVEALIRWVHPQKGLVSPAEFIPVAEKTGLIVPIGEWVFHTACGELKRIESLGYERFTMAVNLSSRQFREEHFSRSIHDIIRKSGARPESVELELTESILIDGTSDILSILTGFKESGIRLSIDDFGTGYSSLSYLKLFPIDKVKIDQSFTKNAGLNPKDRNLIRAIIAMSHAFNFTTIAEGVETEAQLDMMREDGCNEVQGYYIAKPMPASELETFLYTFIPPAPKTV